MAWQRAEAMRVARRRPVRRERRGTGRHTEEAEGGGLRLGGAGLAAERRTLAVMGLGHGERNSSGPREEEAARKSAREEEAATEVCTGRGRGSISKEEEEGSPNARGR